MPRDPIRRRHRGAPWRLLDDDERSGGHLLPGIRSATGDLEGPSVFTLPQDHAGLAAARKEAASLDPDEMELTCRIRGPRVVRLARIGDRRRLRKIVKYHKATVNVTDRTGATAVMHAVRHGKRDTLRLLLEGGAQDSAQSLLESRSDSGWTALLEACHYGEVPCLSVLLRNGARIDHASESGTNGLMLAAASGHGEAVQVLLTHADHAESIAASEAAAFAVISRIAELATEATKLATTTTREKRAWVPVRSGALGAGAKASAAASAAAAADLEVRRADKLCRRARKDWLLGGSNFGAALIVALLNGAEQRAEQRRAMLAVLLSWRMVRLRAIHAGTVAKAAQAAAQLAEAKAANAAACERVGEGLHAQLQHKKTALREFWAKNRRTVDRHLANLRRGVAMIEREDMDGWRALHHAASQGAPKHASGLSSEPP